MADDNRKKKYETEWSFSFEQFGENIARLMTQLGVGADATVNTVHLHEPLGDTQRANIRLDFTIGHTSIDALADDNPYVIEADITSVGRVEMNTQRTGDRLTARLRQTRTESDNPFQPVIEAVDTFAHQDELSWAIRLTPNIPIELAISSGLTTNMIDLSRLDVPKLKVTGGAGNTVVLLPSIGGNALINGGVGTLAVTVSGGHKNVLRLESGAGNSYVDVLPGAGVEATIEGGVGNCTVTVPKGAALRISAESGLGNIVVPSAAAPVSIESEFISESGVWQTPDFNTALHKIDIRYEGGVGSLIVEEEEDVESGATA